MVEPTAAFSTGPISPGHVAPTRRSLARPTARSGVAQRHDPRDVDPGGGDGQGQQ